MSRTGTVRYDEILNTKRVMLLDHGTELALVITGGKQDRVELQFDANTPEGRRNLWLRPNTLDRSLLYWRTIVASIMGWTTLAPEFDSKLQASPGAREFVRVLTSAMLNAKLAVDA